MECAIRVATDAQLEDCLFAQMAAVAALAHFLEAQAEALRVQVGRTGGLGVARESQSALSER